MNKDSAAAAAGRDVSCGSLSPNHTVRAAYGLYFGLARAAKAYRGAADRARRAYSR